MAPRTRRHEWRQHQGRWTRSLGERGARVRLFQLTKGSSFYREVYLPQTGVTARKSLGTRDRAEAERLGRALLAALLRGGIARCEPTAPLTLGTLWERYARECPGYLDNGETTRSNTEANARILLGFFGAACEVAHLTTHDQDAFTRKRLAGGIRIGPQEKAVTRPVRARAVEVSLKLLHAMLTWATTVRRPNGERLLSTHPLAGVKRLREHDPKRPIATRERFDATRAAMQQLARDAGEDEAVRQDWDKVEMCLVLAEATGRRLGAIRHLRWEDVHLTKAEILWRAETDKKRRTWLVPIPQRLVDELRAYQRRMHAVGGYLFPSQQDAAVPIDRHMLRGWLERAEHAAGVEKLDGSLWHAYRRKWATERKHLSLKDVAAVGGWSDVGTLLTCYQQADRATMLAVMSTPVKLSESGGLAAEAGNS